jgi:hypothetical protein
MEKQDSLGFYQPRDVVQVPYLWFAWSLIYGALGMIGLRYHAVKTTPKLPAVFTEIDWDVVFKPMFSWSQALEGIGFGCMFAFGLWLTARIVFRGRSAEHRMALFMLGLMGSIVGIILVVFAPV